MTHINELFPERDFREQLAKGNIRVQSHPDFPELAIANYTDQVAFARDWNPVTMMCRGLIWNIETHQVLARPFPKFFNWDERESPPILDDQVVWHWADKADGSLGIMYLTPNNDLRIATRGSFASAQAKLGMALLNDAPWYALEEYRAWIEAGYTPLVEICGPDNRIVLRYEDNLLVGLGYMHIETGRFIPADSNPQRTMRELLGDLSRSNAEGWVVWLSNTKPLKIKQADYIELHRMVSNLTEKEVWRQLRAGTYSTYVAQLPDELFALADVWADELRRKYVPIHTGALGLYQTVYYGGHSSRKSQAMWIQANVPAELRGFVFGLLDGKDINDGIWRMIEPRGVVYGESESPPEGD